MLGVEAAVRHGRPVLDRAFADLSAVDPARVVQGMERLVDGLGALRKRLPPPSWDVFCRTECVTHPVRYLVHQDPLTERSYFKPRGYPGDYATLVGIYDNVPKTRGFGGYFDLYFLNTVLARGVRERMLGARQFLHEGDVAFRDLFEDGGEVHGMKSV